MVWKEGEELDIYSQSTAMAYPLCVPTQLSEWKPRGVVNYVEISLHITSEFVWVLKRCIHIISLTLKYQILHLWQIRLLACKLSLFPCTYIFYLTPCKLSCYLWLSHVPSRDFLISFRNYVSISGFGSISQIFWWFCVGGFHACICTEYVMYTL